MNLRMHLSVTLSVLLALFIGQSLACGPITHVEISHRALHNYADKHGSSSYETILKQNQPSLEAGNAFPDAFYPSYCFGGKYHGVSESAHWTPFINASINYINKHYPKPWNENARKVIAFVMGILSHQVADVSWHSLGIDQGFLQTMSKSNFHDVFNKAHPAGDLGGDVLNLALLNLNYTKIFGDWYVPVDDVVEIYKELYGTEKISKTVVVVCTKLLYLSKVAERLVVKEYFPISAEGSPFLLNELYSYFLGGIDDMADWTQRSWRYFTFALEYGQNQCYMPHNPLYIRCNETSDDLSMRSNAENAVLKNGFFNKVSLQGLSLDDVEAENDGRGVVFRSTASLERKVSQREHHSLKFSSERSVIPVETAYQKVNEETETVNLPKTVFYTNVDYAKLGSAFAVADLNNDGNDDVIIGSPGFQLNPLTSVGVVFILYGTDDGLKTSVTDIYKAADAKISAPLGNKKETSLFGSSLTVLDFDKDGKPDIAISAPSYGSSHLAYNGRVYLYSSDAHGNFYLKGEILCEKHYCNLGVTLAVWDMNSDGYDDLVIGSPFSPSSNATQQRGTVAVMLADHNHAGKSSLSLQFSSLSPLFDGSEDYSWMGSSIETRSFPDNETSYILLGEPGYRICASVNCSYQPNDIQAVGRAYIVSISAGIQAAATVQGKKTFELTGSHVGMGRPFGSDTDVFAVSSTGADVRGRVLEIPVTLKQVGSVRLYNMSDPAMPLLSTFSGDRLFGRYGSQIKFADLNRDGYDEMIVSAPFRTKDFTEEISGSEQGRVYIYLGGPKFPRGEATSDCGFFQPVNPCPGKVAYKTLALGENFARFGSKLSVVKSKRKVNLLVTASHSSRGGRLSGIIGVYDF